MGGGTCKTNKKKQGGGGSKIVNFEWTYFLKLFIIRNIKTAVKNLLKSEFFSAIFMFLIVKSFRKWLEVKKHIFLHLYSWYSFEFFELNSSIFLWHMMRQYSKNLKAEVHWKHCHTFKMELCVNIVHDWKPLINYFYKKLQGYMFYRVLNTSRWGT